MIINEFGENVNDSRMEANKNANLALAYFLIIHDE